MWMGQNSIDVSNYNTLEKLMRMGVPIPKLLPDGGVITLNSDGAIVSSVTGKRFKVFASPKLQRKR